MPRWIRYKNGEFGGVYEGETITFKFGDEPYVVTPETDDQILFTIGCLRLKKSEPAHKNRPYHIKMGPHYVFANDGSAEVTETWDYDYHEFEDVKRLKLDEWHRRKDRFLCSGIKWEGRSFDMRYRNLSHLSILAALIRTGSYPENFEWFDADGNTFPLNEEQCISLMLATATQIKDLEVSFLEEFKYINSIVDIDELCNYQFKER